MNLSFFVFINSSSCYIVTSVSTSLVPPSIIMICWRVWSFLFCGEPVGFKLNHYLDVDNLVRIFTWCDYWIGRGDIVAECTNQCSLMNCYLATTSWKGFLYCYTTTFLFFPWTGYGFGKPISVSLLIIEISVISKLL